MKVEINNKEQNTEIKFPCLMISEKGNLVFMTEIGHGFALKHTKKDIGYFSDLWDMDNFKPFNGSITLSNE